MIAEKNDILSTSLIIILISLFLGSCVSDDHITSTILMDHAYLLDSKAMIEKDDPGLKKAFEQLIYDADMVLEEGPYTVTDKEKLPPSGDKHDYASYSRYWWPDPNAFDGLPYIRRDGETNPASQSPKESDRPRIGSLGDNTETLGLAYFFTGKQVYAKKAAELLRVWFLDESTRMNPNLNHAQCRPGHNTGSKSGVLDGRLMIRALEGSLLISGSSELSDAELKGLKSWANAYLMWLTQDTLALQEAASKNNHGSYYDLQVIYFALYSENTEVAKKIANQFLKNRVFTQIESDGSMPKEIERTRPLFYSMYNLHALFLVAYLSEKVGVDIWQATENSSRLKKGLDYLLPYVDTNKIWPQPTIGEADRMDMFIILKMANRAFPDQDYIHFMNTLPIEKRKIHRSHIAYPLMR